MGIQLIRNACRKYLQINRRYRLLMAIICIFVVVLLVACQAEKSAPGSLSISESLASMPTMPGAELFNAECAKCHGLRRVLNKDKDEQTWINTILRMKNKHQAKISGNQVKELVAFHVSRQKKENEIFQKKCNQCHSGNRYVEKALTPAQARAIITQMQQKAGNKISDKDVDLIVNYHIREHQRAVQRNLQNILSRGGQEDEEFDMDSLTLFVEKCSSCHEPERGLDVFKTERQWRRTLRKMQAYSRGYISHDDLNMIQVFLISRQSTEEELFKETCTRCHSTDRIITRSMPYEDWIKVIKRMQVMAPQHITDEKIQVLTSYIMRHENVMTSLFYDQCDRCHQFLEKSGSIQSLATNNKKAINSLVLRAEQLLPQEKDPAVVTKLLKFHRERERVEMAVFQGDCFKCHPEGKPVPGDKKSRDEWALLIASFQNRIHNTRVTNSIDIQIKYHALNPRKRWSRL